jgi:hypothetical protein
MLFCHFIALDKMAGLECRSVDLLCMIRSVKNKNVLIKPPPLQVGSDNLSACVVAYITVFALPLSPFSNGEGERGGRPQCKQY